MSELLTTKEAAAFLRVHVNTMRRYLNSGEIPAFRVGTRDWRVAKEDLEAYMRSQRSR